MRFRGGEARQSRAPGARHSPLPPCRRAWWGGTRAPADAGCSVGSAPLCVRCSPARALPTGSRLPTSTPWRRADPGALTGLRSAARALPAGSMALPDLRVRPQRRPENGRRRLGPDAPVRPWCSAGRTVARARGRRRAGPPGRCRPRGSRTPPRRHCGRARFAQGCAATEQALGTRRGPGTPEPYAVLTRTKFWEQCDTYAFSWLSGDAWIISHQGIRNMQ